MKVRPKKHLGQHFLRDENIAAKIVRQLSPGTRNIIEIGPGTGVLTRYLLDMDFGSAWFIETDPEAFSFLASQYPGHSAGFIQGDFLKLDLDGLTDERLSIIGNLPYNISSQIFFRVLQYRDKVDEVVCMVQKEVAERIASGPGSKKYGILSVLLQAYYDIEILFQVSEHVFIPPPKVKSAVMKLKRNGTVSLTCDENVFTGVVKKAFNQRRKALRNSLRGFVFKDSKDPEIVRLLSLRPEQMGIGDFIFLAENVTTGL